ncbi:MAG: hypothetical protein JXA93_00135 [Anaerolineae bacterium]|nr:hypothetical protein [Anaerolineae bacterium]
MHSTFRLTLFAAVLLSALVLAACSPAPNTEDVSPIGTPAPATTEDTPSPVARGDGEADAVESARADLADRLGISPSSIQVVSVEQVDWPDTSLGCPQEGQMYAQVIVPGQRVVFEADGEQYVYHTGDGNVILCEKEASTPSQSTPEVEIDPAATALVEQAQADLSQRLDVAMEGIAVQAVEAVQWRDSSLGCPKPGMNYLQVITPGYLIRLEAKGEVYEYHTSQSNVVYCENPETEAEGNVINQLIAAARADLASVTGMAEGKIEVIETEYVEWRDSSLGCPKAGQSYLQVITPGYLIRLRAGGEEYEYHTSMKQVILCRQ